MGVLLAECAVHGIMPVWSPIQADGRNTFEHVGLECPICRGPAYVLPGDYDMTRSRKGGVTWFYPTPAARRRLQTVLVWAQQELARDSFEPERVAAATAKAIERDAPVVWSKISKFLKSPALQNGTGVAMLLVAILALILSANQGISAEDLDRLLDETVRSIQEEQTPDTPPPTDRMPPVMPPASEHPDAAQDA